MVTQGWRSWAWSGFKYAAGTFYNGVASVVPKVGAAMASIYHKTIDASVYTKDKIDAGHKIYTDVVSVVDLTDKVQTLDTVDAKVKAAYHCVQPKVVESFFQRFDTQTMLDVAAFSHLASTSVPKLVNQVPGVKGVALNAALGAAKCVVDVDQIVEVHVKTAGLGAVTWAADKMQSKLPDGDAKARSDFAAGIASDLHSVMTLVEKSAARAREDTGCSWGQKRFVETFNIELQASPLAQQQVGKDTFYKKLATRLLKKMEKDLPNSLGPQQADLVKTALAYLDEETKRDKVAELLMGLHKEITDPTRIKQWLIAILDASSEGLDQTFSSYMKKLEPGEVSTVEAETYDTAYGQSIMELLQTIQPKAFQLNIMGIYAKFQKKGIAQGEDFLSVILRDATGSSIESMMTSNTDEWLKSALKIARMNLIGIDDHLIEYPGYITEDEWHDLNPAQQADVKDEKTVLGKQFKDRHIARVDAAFLKSSRAMAGSVLRAGLVVEQWIPTLKQVAADPSRSRFIRGLAHVVSIILTFSGVKFILDLLHRINIYLRMKIADLASKRTGNSIASRVDELLHTKALDIMAMQMLERAMSRLNLLDDEGVEDVTYQDSALVEMALSSELPLEEVAHEGPFVQEGDSDSDSYSNVDRDLDSAFERAAERNGDSPFLKPIISRDLHV